MKKFIFLLCAFFLTGKAHSQNNFQEYKKIIYLHEGIALERIVDSLIDKSLHDHKDEEAAKIAHEFSLEQNKKKEVDKAIKYGIKEVEILKKINPLDKKLSNALFNIGFFYNLNRDFDNSTFFYNQVIEHNIDVEQTAKSYCKIAENYNEQGDFYKSIQFYNKGISLLEQQENYGAVITHLNNASLIFENTKEAPQQKKLLDKALNLSKKTTLPNRTYYSLHNNLGLYYTNNKSVFDFKEAKKHYTLNLTRALQEKDSTTICKTYNNLGDLYNIVQKDSANYYLNLGAKYCKSTYSKGIRLHQFSNYYTHKNDLKKALLYINKSLNTNLGRTINNQEPVYVSNLINNAYKLEILESLIKKATVLIQLQQKHNDYSYLEDALETIVLADQLIDVIQRLSSETQSELHWRSEASRLYFLGMYCAEILNKDDQAFYFTEKNKALLLIEGIVKNTKRGYLPKALVAEETALKKAILKLENKKRMDVDSATVKTTENLLFSKKQAYEKLTDSLSQIYPDYFSNATAATLFSLKEIQETLKKDDLVISYIWNVENDLLKGAYGIAVSKKETQLFKIPDFEGLQELLIQYRTAISKPFEKNQEINEFKTTSFQLFQHLFPSQEIQQLLIGKKLKIIPDAVLQNIPFEALITAQNTEEYLIKSNEISYAYSMSSLIHNATIERKTANDFIGFAPVSFQHTKLDSLSKSITEIETINLLLQGDLYTRKKASKNAFLENANRYKTIHLATHTSASNEPWIAFHDTQLHLNELYAFQNQASLVVMSSCDTSLGTIANGEGALSLARGFLHSGANAVIASLWKVNDKNTAAFFPLFYKNLKNGASKAEALRDAKLTYLENNSLSQASPYYWASFILIGDTQEIYTTTTNTLMVIIGMSLLIVCICIALYMKKKKKNHPA